MKRVLRFWWGNKVSTMSKNRSQCYRSIIRNSKVEIEMITPENYKEYEVEGYPIHEAFEYLSEVHKSDYIRAYVGYHYGGGWTDIKYCDYDWNQYFDILDNNPDKIAIGFPEMIIRDGEYKRLPEGDPHRDCLGMSNFIFREKTPVFYEFMAQVHSKLDEKLELLKQYPGTVHPMVCLDNHLHYTHFPEHLRTYQYPLKWLEISEIYFCTQLQCLDKIMHGMPPAHNFMTGHDHR